MPAPDVPTGYGKSMAAVAAGAFATILVWVADQYLPAPMPAEISAAVQTLITAGAVYFTPHNFGGGA